jgi:hypothetical protein
MKTGNKIQQSKESKLSSHCSEDIKRTKYWAWSSQWANARTQDWRIYRVFSLGPKWPEFPNFDKYVIPLSDMDGWKISESELRKCLNPKLWSLKIWSYEARNCRRSTEKQDFWKKFCRDSTKFPTAKEQGPAAQCGFVTEVPAMKLRSFPDANWSMTLRVSWWAPVTLWYVSF